MKKWINIGTGKRTPYVKKHSVLDRKLISRKGSSEKDMLLNIPVLYRKRESANCSRGNAYDWQTTSCSGIIRTPVLLFGLSSRCHTLFYWSFQNSLYLAAPSTNMLLSLALNYWHLHSCNVSNTVFLLEIMISILKRIAGWEKDDA